MLTQENSTFVDIISTFGLKGVLHAGRRSLTVKSRPIRQQFVNFNGQSPNPTEVLWVPTDMIKHFGTCLTKNQVNGFGAVYSGPWDRPIGRIEHLPYYKSFKRHFDAGVPWKKTYFYRDQLRKLKSSSTQRISNREELQERLSFLDDLYERICTEGYKTQKDLLSERPSETQQLNNDVDTPELNEIGICIGRSGRLFKHGAGTHRLIIAKILDIEKVPVQVRVRHRQWEQIRKRAAAGSGIEDKIYSHPDISDIENTS